MDAYGYGRGLSKLVGGHVSTSGRWRWRRIGSVMVVLLELCACCAWMDFRPDELWNANYFMSERSRCCETPNTNETFANIILMKLFASFC
jgi:hypothetical protein